MPDAMSVRPIFIFTFQAHNGIVPYLPMLKLLFAVATSCLCFSFGQKVKRSSQADAGHPQRADASEMGSFARAEIQRNSSGTVAGCGGCCGRDGGVRLLALVYRSGGFAVRLRVELELCWFPWPAALWRVRSVAWCPGGRWGTGEGKIPKEGLQAIIRDVNCCSSVRKVEKGLGKRENTEF